MKTAKILAPNVEKTISIVTKGAYEGEYNFILDSNELLSAIHPSLDVHSRSGQDVVLLSDAFLQAFADRHNISLDLAFNLLQTGDCIMSCDIELRVAGETYYDQRTKQDFYVKGREGMALGTEFAWVTNITVELGNRATARLDKIVADASTQLMVLNMQASATGRAPRAKRVRTLVEVLDKDLNEGSHAPATTSDPLVQQVGETDEEFANRKAKAELETE